jgi:hypothetical protein
MPNVRPSRCASCGAPVLWLRAYGFDDPRPIEPEARADGDVVIEVEDARYRHVGPGEPPIARRYRLHWPCPAARGPVEPAPRRVPLDVSVIAHTHWDREWYRPFESFRARLVDVVDEVLDVLDGDPAFVAFHLDGHTAIVDDYLAARPAEEARLRRLVAAGRLVVGPWETLADEFLVSGETLVRDLQRGMRRARELGGVLPVGYLPDQFGHTAQLPQLLTLAGIADVLVYRGVPESLGATRFRWQSPDGSVVLAERLPAGYCNAIRIEDDPKLLVDRARVTEIGLGAGLRGDLLLMNGCDHQRIQPWVPGVLAEANRLEEGECRFTMRRLDEHLARQPVDGLPLWLGELRASGPATVTPGVTSNRIDVRVATAAAERAVEQRAEPLAALYLPPDEWPGDLLDVAWRHLLHNAAHDSMAACSADPVVRAVLLRAADAQAIADHVSEGVLTMLTGSVDAPPGSVLVVNTSSRRRHSPVVASVLGEGPCHLVTSDGVALPTQLLATSQDIDLDVTASGDALDAVIDLIGSDRAAGHRIAAWALDDGESAWCTLTIASDDEPSADLGPVLDALVALRDERPPRPVHVVVRQPPARTVLALVDDVAPFGWSALTVAHGLGPGTAVDGGDGWIANEHLRVEAAADGTLRIESADGVTVDGVGRLVDGGDAGDVYDWSPPDVDTPVDAPDAVWIEPVERGPVRARMDVVRTYSWPVALVHDGAGTRRAAATEAVEVRTVVELVAGERFLRLTVELDNPSRDHRLRLHVPLPAPVLGSDAESAFAVVHRPLEADGNPMEAALATSPSHRFVDCSDGALGVALVHDGTGEHEVVDGGREVAFTLFRSVGQLSRDDGASRPNATGPTVALPEAQLLGAICRRMAVVLHRGGWEGIDLPAIADELLLPIDAACVTASTRARPAAGGRLDVRGAEVSAVVRHDGALEVRVVRLSPTHGRVAVDLDGSPATGTVVDLHGTPRRPFHGTLALRPWEVVTIRVDE